MGHQSYPVIDIPHWMTHRKAEEGPKWAIVMIVSFIVTMEHDFDNGFNKYSICWLSFESRNVISTWAWSYVPVK